MSYEPTVWKSGDVVTSAKLNKLEQGVAGGGSGGGLVVTGLDIQNGGGALNKTWQEIFDAVSSGRFVVLTGSFEHEGQTYYAVYPLREIEKSMEDGYTLICSGGKFSCESADDYPTGA